MLGASTLAFFVGVPRGDAIGGPPPPLSTTKKAAVGRSAGAARSRLLAAPSKAREEVAGLFRATQQDVSALSPLPAAT
eukprot:scaffold4779_cov116-Isochrysis_galbana.AAC.1